MPVTQRTGSGRIAGSLSQRVFDVFLRTLAEPGTVATLPDEVVRAGLPMAMWLPLSVAAVDVTATVAPDPNADLNRIVADATGARMVAADQAWVAALLTPDVEVFDRLPRGDAWSPENGSRCAVGVRDLNGDTPGDGSVALALAGPGVPGTRTLTVDGITPSLASRLGRASGTFPAGVDVWFVSDRGEVAAVSRSTTVTVGPADQLPGGN